MSERLAALLDLRRTRLARETAWVAAGQLLVALGRFGGVRLLTQWVEPTLYGQVALLLVVSALGTNVLSVPVLQAVLRWYPEAVARRGMRTFLGVAARMLVWTVVPLAAALLIGGAVWNLGLGKAPSFAAFVALVALLLVDLARSFEVSLLNAARRQAALSAWSVADAWARPLGAVAAVIVAGPAAFTVLAGTWFGTVAAFAAFWGRRVRPGTDDAPEMPAAWAGELRREFRSFAAPLVPFALLAWVVNTSDRYLVAGWAGVAQAGIYAAGYGLASQPFMTLTSIGVTAFRPVLFEAASAGDRGKERRIVALWASAAAAGAAVGTVGFVALGGLVTRLALAPEYRSAVAVLPWIAAAYGIQGVQIVFETMIYARRRPKRLLFVQIVGAATAVAGYAALIPSRGAVGAAIATLLAMTASCAAAAALALYRVAGGRTSGNAPVAPAGSS